MGKKKVFASDFDGTLYFYQAADEDKLPQANVDKIREYQAAGHLFGLCTGRQVGGLTPFIGGLVEPDFYITSTGANIVDRELKEIRKRGVPRETADGIVQMIRDRGRERGEEYRMTLDVEGMICVFAEMDYPGEYRVIREVEDCPEGLIHQVSCHTESVEDAQEIVDLVNERFGETVNAFRNVIEVDIAPKGCTKGEGVAFLKKYMGDCKLYGIGDSMNDLPLIEAADKSYTFPYAPRELQERVDMVVETIVDALEDSMKDPAI